MKSIWREWGSLLDTWNSRCSHERQFQGDREQQHQFRRARARNRVQKVSSEGRENATTNNCCTGEKKPQPVAARKLHFFFALLSPLFLNNNAFPLDKRAKQLMMWWKVVGSGSW